MENDTNKSNTHPRSHSDKAIEKIKEKEEFQYQQSLTKQKLSDEQNICNQLPASIGNTHHCFTYYNSSC